jgi:OFA family oxalate/formate antiporter-like MFS transporter
MISQHMHLIGDLFGTKISASSNGAFYMGKAISGFMGGTIFAALFAVNKSESFLFVLICIMLAIVFLALSTYDKQHRKENPIENIYNFP